jgi:cytochrome c oxidase assembly protein subunit 15
MVQPRTQSYDGVTQNRLHVSPRLFRRVADLTVIVYGLIIVTGGAVRLTGSGLGCPDWPTCYHDQVTPALSFHPLIEFSNRMVTILLVIISAAAFLGALRREPHQRNLVWPSAILVLGVFAQAGIGGLVVYTKLNPYVVSLHFLLTFILLADAVVLAHRARNPPTPVISRVDPVVAWIVRGMMVMLVVVIMAGTVTTGSGPHAGSPGTKRFPIAFRDAAELHADLALFLVGATLVALFAFYLAGAPEEIQRLARIFFTLLVIQGILGYTQYFLHDFAPIIEFHMLGATLLFITLTLLLLSLHLHVPDRPDDGDETGVDLRARVSVATETTPLGTSRSAG